MKKRGLIFLAVATLAIAAVAQRTGMELKGFRVPEYNDDSTMKSQLFGERAILRDDGLVEISGLKIELYNIGESNAVVTAPHCLYDRNTRNASSDGDVKVEMQEMTLTGKGFLCEGEEYRFSIKSDAKVVLKGVTLGIEDN